VSQSQVVAAGISIVASDPSGHMGRAAHVSRNGHDVVIGVVVTSKYSKVW